MSSGRGCGPGGMSTTPAPATTLQNLGVMMFAVADQDAAIAFYTEKLGFELRGDTPFGEDGSMRWVEVAPPGSVARLVFACKAGSGCPASFRKILIHCAGHPDPASPPAPCFIGGRRSTNPAGSGVADAVNRNWLNGVGDPVSGCDKKMPPAVRTLSRRAHRAAQRHQAADAAATTGTARRSVSS